MINRLKELFAGSETARSTGSTGAEAFHVAAAALLVEAAHLDAHYGAVERETILKVLTNRFDLSGEDAQALVASGEDAQEQAVELYGFTKKIKEALAPEERTAIIEMMWEVAYADGVLHDYEAHLVRRVAGLIYVTDRDRGEARKRVLERLGLGDDGTGSNA